VQLTQETVNAETDALRRELFAANPLNQQCADCGASEPGFAVLNFGCLVCGACHKAHQLLSSQTNAFGAPLTQVTVVVVVSTHSARLNNATTTLVAGIDAHQPAATRRRRAAARRRQLSRQRRARSTAPARHQTGASGARQRQNAVCRRQVPPTCVCRATDAWRIARRRAARGRLGHDAAAGVVRRRHSRLDARRFVVGFGLVLVLGLMLE
jgi:hypothetical protein